jgi:archaellum component FlaG (FlaF/FlaG flagellin family)
MRTNAIKKIFSTLFLAALSSSQTWGASPSPQQPKPAHLRVISKPADARIIIDGKQSGSSPMTVTLAPGKHILVAEKRDYLPLRQTVDLTQDQRASIELKLKPITGLVLIHSDPDKVDVEIDGASRGTTPLFVADLAFGSYRAKFIKPGYLSKEVNIRITRRAPIKLDVKLTADSATLAVDSTPQGASVTVNGVNRGTTPCVVDKIPSGRATLELEMDGYNSFRQRLVLAAGERQPITASLKAIPSTLKVVSNPDGARIYVNNQFKGKAPVTLEKLSPGTYRVRAEMKAHDPMARDIEIGRAQNIVEEFRMRPNAGSIEITTEPAGVKVLLDGKAVGTTIAKSNNTDRISQPLTVSLIPCGSQTLKLTKPSYYSKSVEINIERDQTYTHHFRLKRRFIPNYEIKTKREVYRGVLISVDAQRNVKIETAPGIFKTIRHAEITSATPLREDKTKASLKH